VAWVFHGQTPQFFARELRKNEIRRKKCKLKKDAFTSFCKASVSADTKQMFVK